MDESNLLYDEKYESVEDSWLIMRVRLDSLETIQYDPDLVDNPVDTMTIAYTADEDIFKGSNVSGDSLWLETFDWYGGCGMYFYQLYLRYDGPLPPKEWK